MPPRDEPPNPLKARSSLGKGLAIGLAVAIVVIAERLGVLHHFGDPSRLARTLVELGAYGYVAFLAAYTLLQPFGVPGTVFVFAAPLIWPWPTAFALSMGGTMAASVVGFSFARYVARDWVSARLPARFQRYEAALEARAFLTVFMLRLLFWMPQLLHAFLGISRVRFWTHFWASLLGYLPTLLLVSFFGQRAFEALTKVSLQVWVMLGAVALLLAALLPLAYARYKSGRRRAP